MWSFGEGGWPREGTANVCSWCRMKWQESICSGKGFGFGREAGKRDSDPWLFNPLKQSNSLLSFGAPHSSLSFPWGMMVFRLASDILPAKMMTSLTLLVTACLLTVAYLQISCGSYHFKER